VVVGIGMLVRCKETDVQSALASTWLSKYVRSAQVAHRLPVGI
jgi:hypothetical protein